jgi:hypothetical protein
LGTNLANLIIQWVIYETSVTGGFVVTLPTSFTANWVFNKQTNYYTTSTDFLQLRGAYAEKVGLNQLKIPYATDNRVYLFTAIGY